MFNLDPRTSYIALENPRWAGGDDEGRVYAADLVEYDESDEEIGRQQVDFPITDGYYPRMADLQRLVDDVNSGRRTRRE